ncbi:MAG: hypothetical protein DRK00_09885 [Thermoprotei archaeon]|nr:MAG: hypothetical protein DRK00_09885 [Thermoprotei archaeon]
MFDVNAFVLPGDIAGQVSTLQRELGAYGFRGALISPLNPRGEAESYKLNEALLAALRRAPRGYYAAVAVGGEPPSLGERVRGIRVYPGAGVEGLRRGAELAEREKLALVISVRSAWGRPALHLGSLVAILEEYRQVPVVLSGVSYHEAIWLVSEAPRYPNLYVEISLFHQMSGLRLLVEALGPRRLMLGTAYPLQNPCVAALKLALSGLSPSILQEIGEKNAVRVLRV